MKKIRGNYVVSTAPPGTPDTKNAQIYLFFPLFAASPRSQADFCLFW